MYEAWLVPVQPQWLLMAALTLVSGALALRMSSVPFTFSVSDAFTFGTLLLFGPTAAMATVALDGLVMCLRMTPRPAGLLRPLFNSAAPALAMWVTGQVLLATIGAPAPASVGLMRFVPALALVAVVYFVLQTGLVAVAIALSSQRNPFDVWRENFARLWISFFGGAYFAGLMVVSERQLGPAYLAFVLPLPFLLYFTFKTALGSIEDHVRHVAALDTERSRAEGARRQSEAMFETLAETMSVGVFIVQGDRLRYVNTAAETMTGFDRLELKSMAWYDVGDADSRVLMRNHAAAVERGEAAPKRCDVGFLTRSGSRRWVEMSWAAIPFEGERAVLAVAVDITERTEARRALEQVTEVYRSLIQGAVFGIYRAALDGLFLDVNPALVTMLGYASSDELVEASAAGLIYADAAQKMKLQHVYQTTGRIQNVEVQWKHRDGHSITVRLSGRAVMDGHGAVIAFEVIAEDVTERRQLEEQLRQAQKMEAVGRLAGGVAHDFNNLLTAIIGYSHLLTAELGDAPTASHVEEITNAATRAAALTGQLLAFSRKQVLNPTVLDLRAQVEQLDKMLRRLIGADIDLQIALPSELWRVHGDAGQIDQVLLNLAVNARDAMPRGGRLTVEVGNRELDAAEASRLGVPAPGQYVVLSVADNGSGIDAATLPHIFEPFFTTKEIGRGTGLGLATVYGVVTQSGGHIHVTSQPQRGTTFSIYLPAVQDAVEPVPHAAVQMPSPSGTETVLLVEDEPGVRRLAIRVLEKQGYKVLSADNAVAALQLASTSSPIDLLITDIVMPGQSGPDLAAQLAAGRPGLKILFISGYSERRLLDANQCAAGAFLQKPFTPSVLAQRVRECLDTPLAA